MITLTEERANKLWDAVIRQYNGEPELQTGEMTKAQIKEKYGLSENQVEGMIRKCMHEGSLQRRPILVHGHKTFIYWVTDNENK